MDASTDENYFSADDGADTRNSSAKCLNTPLGREGGGVMNHHPNRSEHEQTDYTRQDPKLHVPGRHFGTIPKALGVQASGFPDIPGRDPVRGDHPCG